MKYHMVFLVIISPCPPPEKHMVHQTCLCWVNTLLLPAKNKQTKQKPETCQAANRDQFDNIEIRLILQ